MSLFFRKCFSSACHAGRCVSAVDCLIVFILPPQK
jgi:hypothetical protein